MKKLLFLSLICFTSANMVGMNKHDLGGGYLDVLPGAQALKNAPEEPIEFVWTAGDLKRAKESDPELYAAELNELCKKKAQARAQFIIDTMLPKVLKGMYSHTFLPFGSVCFGFFDPKKVDALYRDEYGLLEKRHFESIESQTKKIVAEHMQKNWAQKSTKKVKHRKRKS